MQFANMTFLAVDGPTTFPVLDSTRQPIPTQLNRQTSIEHTVIELLGEFGISGSSNVILSFDTLVTSGLGSSAENSRVNTRDNATETQVKSPHPLQTCASCPSWAQAVRKKKFQKTCDFQKTFDFQNTFVPFLHVFIIFFSNIS